MRGLLHRIGRARRARRCGASSACVEACASLRTWPSRPATVSRLPESEEICVADWLAVCGDLIGKARQALMQRFHRIAQAVVGDAALHPVEALGEADHMRAELIESLRLFARGDVHLHRGLAHHAVAFALAAFGGVEPAAHAAQLFFDAAIDAGGFGFAARHAVEHLVAVAPARSERGAPRSS